MTDAAVVPAARPARLNRLLVVSGVLTLIGLALMAWSMLVPSWLPVVVAMSAGQLVGITAFALYLIVIVRDLRRPARAAREAPP